MFQSYTFFLNLKNMTETFYLYAYKQKLCLAYNTHLRPEVSLRSVEFRPTYRTTYGKLCVDVHRAINIRASHSACICVGSVVAMLTTVATINRIVYSHSRSNFKVNYYSVLLFHSAK